MSRRVDAVAVVAAVAAAVACEWLAGAALPGAAGDGLAGSALLCGGAFALGGGRARSSAVLLLAGGAAWLAGTLSASLVYAHRGPLVHLLLAYPGERRPSRPVAVIIAIAYLDGAIEPLARSDELTVALAVLAVVAAAGRHRAVGGRERRARAAALAATVGFAGVLAASAAARLGGGRLGGIAIWAYDGAVVLAAVGLAADILWGRWARAAVTELMADLGTLDGPALLRARLARALGDPALRVGYRAPSGDRYLDEDGRPVALDGSEAAQSQTFVEDASRRVAVLIHDPALLNDAQLLDAAASAVRLSAASARLQGEVRARVREVAESRRRLVEAAVEQRRRIEADLHAHAGGRLAALARRLDDLSRARAGDGAIALEEVVSELEQAREDLRRFAQGVHPAVLVERGLRAALDEAAARMPLPVVVDAPAARLPDSIEATIYFLCVEGLANVAKHADATHADIRVCRVGGCVHVHIGDDGCGGARPARGSGLHGLADRIEALGGRLAVESPLGAGTRLEASIPV